MSIMTTWGTKAVLVENTKVVKRNPDIFKIKVPDSRGVIGVPANVMKAAGYMPGDRAYLVSYGYSLYITKTLTPPMRVIGNYIVDKYNNIRINPIVARLLQTREILAVTNGCLISLFGFGR